jgi:hypothetical protein
LTSLNGLKQIVFVTAVYIVIALPLHLLVRLLDRVGKRRDGGGQKNAAVDISAVALITISAVVISAFFSVYADSFARSVKANEGYLDIGSYRVCVDEERCGDTQQTDYRPEFRRFIDQNGHPFRG